MPSKSKTIDPIVHEFYKIKKGLPIEKHNKGIANVIRSMEIGDCIDVPLKSRSNMAAYAARFGIKIITKKQRENGIEFCRVWRTS